jgi:DNA polymerase-4
MSSPWKKIIVHVDMDAFFASVEQLLHKEWRGKPVVVGADPQGGKGRGVVSAASYEARKFGIHSAMPISRAYKACPHAIFVVPHGHVYSDYSKQIFKILESFSPRIEPLSIDEAFMDLTGCLHLHGSVEAMGKKIKDEIKRQTGLTASVGIAPCKSVAKIASDLNKPDGLTIVLPDRLQDFLDALPISRLWGVGQKMQDNLEHLGIRTVKQLRQYPQDLLEKKFGKMGDHINKMARGIDERDVHIGEEAKSVSNEMTYYKDTLDMETVSDSVFRLAEKVSGRMRRAGIRGRTIHLKIRFHDFRTYTRSHTLKDSTNLTHEIFEYASLLLNEFDPLELPVRLVGVGVSNLENEKGQQLSIWDMKNEKILQLEKVMDQIQDKYGKDIIRHAQSLGKRGETEEY